MCPPLPLSHSDEIHFYYYAAWKLWLWVTGTFPWPPKCRELLLAWPADQVLPPSPATPCSKHGAQTIRGARDTQAEGAGNNPQPPFTLPVPRAQCCTVPVNP